MPSKPVRTERVDTRPALLWFPGDWLGNPDLRRCSLAARGLWMDLLMLMWFQNPRGLLPLPVEHYRDQLGVTSGVRGTQRLSHLVCELHAKGVLGCTEDGRVYCRRMYREANGIAATEGKPDAGFAGAKEATDQRSISRSISRSSIDLLTVDGLNTKGDYELGQERIAGGVSQAIKEIETTLGKGHLGEAVVRRCIAVCGRSFDKPGWRERIKKRVASGQAEEVYAALDYIERARDPRKRDAGTVTDPARYLAGTIKKLEGA